MLHKSKFLWSGCGEKFLETGANLKMSDASILRMMKANVGKMLCPEQLLQQEWRLEAEPLLNW